MRRQQQYKDGCNLVFFLAGTVQNMLMEGNGFQGFPKLQKLCYQFHIYSNAEEEHIYSSVSPRKNYSRAQ